MDMNRIEKLREEIEFLKDFVQGLEEIKAGKIREFK